MRRFSYPTQIHSEQCIRQREALLKHTMASNRNDRDSLDRPQWNALLNHAGYEAGFCAIHLAETFAHGGSGLFPQE